MRLSAPRPPITTLSIGITLGAALLASAALAADAPLPLDEANAAIANAVQLIAAAPEGDPEAERHKAKAKELLTRARGELLKAKAAK